VLETVRGIDTVVLDKTGTVTSGAMSVADIEGRTPIPCSPAPPRSSRPPNIRWPPRSWPPPAATRLAVSPVTDFVNEPGTGCAAWWTGDGPVARASDDDGRTSVAVSWTARSTG
jgi:Cu+-exporting ATPase